MLLQVALFVGFLQQISCQISGYYGTAEVKALIDYAKANLDRSTSLRELYYSTNIIKMSSEEDIAGGCCENKSMVPTSAYDIFYLSKVNEACKCGITFGSDMVDTARKSLMAGDLYSIAGGVLATHAIDQLTAQDKLSAMEKIMGLMNPDGKFKSNPTDSTPASLQNLHYVLEMLGAISLDQSSPDVAADVFEKAFQLIPSGDGEAETDPLLIVPLSKLTDKKLRLVGARLVIVAELLLELKYSKDIAVLSNVYEAFRIISSYKASPLYVAITPNTLPLAAAAQEAFKLTVTLKDIFGGAVQCEVVDVTSIKPVGKDSLLFEGAQMTAANTDDATETVFELDMSSSAASMNAGRYIVHLSATVSGRPKPVNYQGFFALTDSVQVTDVSVGITEADSVTGSSSDEISDVEMTAVATQNAISSTSFYASANAAEKVVVQLAVSSVLGNKPRKPHQCFVRLTNQETGLSVYAAGKRDSSSSGGGDDNKLKYYAVISLGDLIEQFQYQSGVYSLSILVGDAAYSTPVEFLLGTVDLRFPAKPQITLPLYAQSLLHTSDTTLQALPEITHQMRPPAKRASSFMSTVFTAATWVPLVMLVGYILSLKPDLLRLKSIYSVIAVLSLAAVLLLYASYWLALDGVSFYQTIRYMFFFFPILVIVGRFSLMSVASIRASEPVFDKMKTN